MLAACGERVNTSSPQALEASINAMMSEMTPEEQVRFSQSLQAIAFDTADVGDDSLFGGATPNGLVLFGAADKLRGKTPEQIVELGYETRIAKLDEELSAGLRAIQAAQSERERYSSIFDAIRIEGPRFYVNRQYIAEPVIEFRIVNESDMVLRRGYFQGTLTSEGRTIPWVDEPFNHEFSGGLEPGESRLLKLSPNMFSEWGQGGHMNRRDLQMRIVLVNVEGSDGDLLLTGQPDDPSALQRELAGMQAEKARLEAELAAL